MNNRSAAVVSDEIRIPNFPDWNFASISSALRRVGIDFEDPEYNQQKMIQSGPFPNGIAFMKGILQFSAPDRLGEGRKYRCPFEVPIRLVEQPPAPGAPMPPSAEYEVELRYEGENYEVSVPVFAFAC